MVKLTIALWFQRPSFGFSLSFSFCQLCSSVSSFRTTFCHLSERFVHWLQALFLHFLTVFFVWNLPDIELDPNATSLNNSGTDGQPLADQQQASKMREQTLELNQSNRILNTRLDNRNLTGDMEIESKKCYLSSIKWIQDSVRAQTD